MSAITWNDLATSFIGVQSEGQSQARWGSPLADEWQKIEADLRAIRRYRDDWNGMGAVAPNPNLVNTAFRFLLTLKRSKKHNAPDAVAASPTGTVVFVWDSGETYTEAEIASTSFVDWMFESASGTTHSSQPLRGDERELVPHQGVEWNESRLGWDLPVAERYSVG